MSSYGAKNIDRNSFSYKDKNVSFKYTGEIEKTMDVSGYVGSDGTLDKEAALNEIQERFGVSHASDDDRGGNGRYIEDSVEFDGNEATFRVNGGTFNMNIDKFIAKKDGVFAGEVSNVDDVKGIEFIDGGLEVTLGEPDGKDHVVKLRNALEPNAADSSGRVKQSQVGLGGYTAEVVRRK